MSRVLYKNFFDIDQEFTKTVREENFLSQPDRWLNFYPHEKFVKLLSDIERMISRTEKGVSVWVEGALGTGKSYAVLTLKKILDASEEDLEKYFNREGYNLSKDLLAKYKTIKREPIVTAYRSGSASITSTRDLIVALQESILAVMRSKGYKGGENSLKEAGIRWLSDPDNKAFFQAKIQKDERCRLNNRTVDSIITELKEPKDDKTVVELIRKCDELGKENDINVFRPEPKEFAAWIKGLLQENGISAFVFIWDEFTEFFQNNLNKLTDFQEHIVGLSDIGFFFVPVTHRSEGLFDKSDSDKKKILDRFMPPIRIELPDAIAFQLIGAALKKDDKKQEDWDKIAQNMNDDITEARKKVGAEVKASDEVMKKILPLHPYSGLVLKYLAEKLQSNQRSMFDFIISDFGDDTKAFQWFIDNRGPFDDKEKYMTIDYLWDFFYKRNNSLLPLEIRTILDAHNRSNAKQLDEEQQIVLKTLLIMIATSRSVNDEKDLLKPNDQNLGLAFLGTDLSGMSAINIAKTLVQQHILYEKDVAGSKKIYSVAMESVDESAIQEIVETLKKKRTIDLVTESELENIMTANPPLKPALKNRVEFRSVTVDDIQKNTNDIINRATYDTKFKNKIPVFLCFARDEREHSALYKKIQTCNAQVVTNGYNPIVFIDMARTPMTETSWRAYLENKARAQYLGTKNPREATEALKLANAELQNWKKAIVSSSFELWYAPIYSNGETVQNLNDLSGMLNTINKNLYKYSPETWCDVIDNLYNDNSIPQGVLLGAKEEIGGTYRNAQKPIEKAIGFAWNNPKYWEQNANLPLSKIKDFVDKTIKEEIATLSQASISNLWNKLQDKPWGFTNCNLCAFLFGFILKEYAQKEGEYYYSDGDIDEKLTIEKIRDIGKETIQNSINPPNRIKEKYIKAKSPEEKQFSESSAKIFGLSEQSCFVGKIRDQLRTKLKSFVFPIWVLKELTDDATVQNILDKYLGVVNTQNYESGQKNETEIVKSIGKDFIDNPGTVIDMQLLITKDNCQHGMKRYLSTYKGGKLIDICNKLQFGDQYLDTLKKKFEVEAATWVWNKHTTDMLIDASICEYQVIEQSQIFGIKPEKPSDIFDAWRSYLCDIKISYDAATAYIKGGELFEILIGVKNYTDISDLAKFLELLKTQGPELASFIKNQKEIFKKIASIWTFELSDEQITDIYIRVGNGHFAEDKSQYKSTIESEVELYRSTLESIKLRNYWKEKTGTETPLKWSEIHATPILALAPIEEIIDAKKAFSTLNSPAPSNEEAKKALTYLESISWWDDLSSSEKRESAFAKTVIGEYAIILTAEKVRDLLNRHLTDSAYYWYSNDQARAKIKELAQATYDTKSVNEAINILDKVSDKMIREYLKKLIKSNMAVGIEIIADNKGE